MRIYGIIECGVLFGHGDFNGGAVDGGYVDAGGERLTGGDRGAGEGVDGEGDAGMGGGDDAVDHPDSWVGRGGVGVYVVDAGGEVAGVDGECSAGKGDARGGDARGDIGAYGEEGVAVGREIDFGA